MSEVIVPQSILTDILELLPGDLFSEGDEAWLWVDGEPDVVSGEEFVQVVGLGLLKGDGEGVQN